MADRAARSLARRAAGADDPEAVLNLLRSRARQGDVSEQLELVAFLTPGGPEALGVSAPELPRRCCETGLPFLQRLGQERPGDPLDGHLRWRDSARRIAELSLDGPVGPPVCPAVPDALADVPLLGPRWVVADLSRCIHLNSQAVGGLCRTYEGLERRGGAVFVAANDYCHTILDMLGLGTLLNLGQDLEQARRQAEERAALPAGAVAPEAWLEELARFGEEVCHQATHSLLAPEAKLPPARRRLWEEAAATLRRSGRWRPPESTPKERELVRSALVPRLLT